jgi:Domain of Unknown Function (DUF1206)
MATPTSEAVQRGRRLLRRPVSAARLEAARDTGWYSWLARVGLVAKGVSFGIVAVLAIKVALGDGGKATSREGALQTIAEHWFGKLLLILLAIGFAAYAIWRFVQAVAENETDEDATGTAKEWGKRAGYVGRGLIYAALTYGAIKILAGSGTESQTAKAHKTTAAVLDWPAGRWIVGAVGVCIVGAGLWNAYRAVTRSFEDKWRTSQMSETERTWGGRAGVAGHLARAVVFGLVGVFVAKAAIDYDPQHAIGIDGALQKLGQASYGPWLLGLTAAGLLGYGLYCLVDARYRDVSTNTG